MLKKTAQTTFSRYISTFLCTLFIFFFSTAMSHGETLELLVDEWPPYHYVNDKGEVDGFAVAVVSNILNKMNRNFRIRVLPFKNVLSQMKSNQVHGSFLASKNDERESYAHFSVSFINSKWVFLKSRGRQVSFSDYSHLEGKRVGVIKGYIYTPEFWKSMKSYNVQLEIYDSDEISHQMLYAGRIDYAIGELENSLWFLQRSNLDDDIDATKKMTVSNEGLYFIWNKKKVKKVFSDKFSEELIRFKASESYLELKGKYLSSY